MALSFTDAFGKNAKLLRTHNQGLSGHPFLVSTTGWQDNNWDEGFGKLKTRYQFNGPDAGTWTFNPKTSAFDFVPIGGDGKVTKSISGAELGLSDPAYQIAGLASLSGQNGDSWSNYALTHNDYGGGVGSQQSMLAGAKDLRGAIGDINAYNNKAGWDDKLLDVGDDIMGRLPQVAAAIAAMYVGGQLLDPSMSGAAGAGTGSAGTTAGAGTGSAGATAAGIEVSPEMAALIENGVTGSKAAADAYAASIAGGTADLMPSLSTVGTVGGTFAPVVDASRVAVDPSGWVSDSAWQATKNAAGAVNTAHTATSITDKVLNKIKDDPLGTIGTIGKAAALGLGIKQATDLNQTGVSADESNLQAAQAKWLNNLNSIATPALRTGMGGLSKMTTQAMDGTLGAQMRNQAGADANAAIGTSANDALRTLSSRGIGLDGNRAMDTLGQWGLGASKVRAGAMNTATNNAENMKWNRAQGLTGLASGQGATANSGMSALTGQLSANRNAGNAANAQAQAGLGQGLMWAAKNFFADGGPVEGPGTETSDSIPARLSDGEFVNNAEAVDLPAEVTQGLVRNWLRLNGTTEDLLHAINTEGLRRRGDHPATGMVSTYGPDGRQHLAGGGLAMALGNMARGAVPVAMELDQQAENTRRWEAENGRAAAAEARNLQQFNFQKQQLERQRTQQAAQDAYMAEAERLGGFRERLDSGEDPNTVALQLAALRNGVAGLTTVGGQPVIANGSLARNDTQVAPVTREVLLKGLAASDAALRRRLAMTSPEGFQKWYADEVDHGFTSRKVGAAEITASAADRNSRTQELYRENEATLLPYRQQLLQGQTSAATAGAAVNNMQAQMGRYTNGQMVVDATGTAWQVGVRHNPATGSPESYKFELGKGFVPGGARGGQGGKPLSELSVTDRIAILERADAQIAADPRIKELSKGNAQQQAAAAELTDQIVRAEFARLGYPVDTPVRLKGTASTAVMGGVGSGAPAVLQMPAPGVQPAAPAAQPNPTPEQLGQWLRQRQSASPIAVPALRPR